MTPRYIDIHSHLNFIAFDEDRDEVIKRAQDAETIVINVGTQIDTSRYAVEIAHQYENVYAIVGLHPIHTGASYHDEQELGEGGKEFTQTLINGKLVSGFTSRGENFDKDAYRELSKDSKVVAIGECGLDYYRLEADSPASPDERASRGGIEKQKQNFIEQIELANEVNKPLMLHIRNPSTPSINSGQANSGQVIPKDRAQDAYADTLEILEKYSKTKGVIHFFESSLENAKKFMALGFMISFTGAITYPPRKNGKGCNYEEVINNIPLNMILTDTDSPYLAPVPHRGKRNEPSYVREIVKRIAEIKNLPEAMVAEEIMNNAKRMFGI